MFERNIFNILNRGWYHDTSPGDETMSKRYTLYALLFVLLFSSTAEARGVIGIGSDSSQGHGILIGMTAWENAESLYFKSIDVYLTFAPPLDSSNFSIFSIGVSSSVGVLSWERVTLEIGIGVAYNLFTYNDIKPTADCSLANGLDSITCDFGADRPEAGGSNLNIGAFTGLRLDISEGKCLFFGASFGGTVRQPVASDEEVHSKFYISPSISYWMSFTDD